MSGNTVFADAAVKLFNAWATNCKGILRMEGYTNNIPDPNLYLIPIQAHQWANAAELLRDYNGWDRNDFEKFKTWMKDTFSVFPICSLRIITADRAICITG